MEMETLLLYRAVVIRHRPEMHPVILTRWYHVISQALDTVSRDNHVTITSPDRGKWNSRNVEMKISPLPVNLFHLRLTTFHVVM